MVNQKYIDDYLSKIEMLERRVGVDTTYKLLEPNEIVLSDLFSLQRAAKTIARFIGIDQFNFVIVPAELSENTAGQIDLSVDKNEVKIEISKKQLEHPEAVHATLAHEITHKFLQFHNIHIGNNLVHQYENEILTDLTAVFLGLGKLMLEGCHVEEVTESSYYNFDSASTTTTSTTITHYTGYLKMEQLGFIYLFVCTMRKIPSLEYMRNLRSDVKIMLEVVQSEHSSYINRRFHTDSSYESLFEEFKAIIEQHQKILFTQDFSSSAVKQLLESQFDGPIQNEHKVIGESLSVVNKLLNDNTFDPCLLFINRVRADAVISNQLIVLSQKFNDAYTRNQNFRRYFKGLRNYLPHLFGTRPITQETIFCPIDGTEIQFTGETSEFVTCPTCYYQISTSSLRWQPSKLQQFLGWMFRPYSSD